MKCRNKEVQRAYTSFYKLIRRWRFSVLTAMCQPIVDIPDTTHTNSDKQV